MTGDREPLTDAERDLLVAFLGELIEHQSNAGCNDYDLPNTPGNVGLMQRVLLHADYAGDPPWVTPPARAKSFAVPCGDQGLACYLARKLAGEVSHG